MNILVLYYSKGGNTRKLAEAIAGGAESVPGVDAVLKTTEEATREDFVASEGVIAGSPVYFSPQKKRDDVVKTTTPIRISFLYIKIPPIKFNKYW